MQVSAEGFVAINYITCDPAYKTRFEELFRSRARAIDGMPGFRHMEVLRPSAEADAYLVVSHWDTEDAFKQWMKSDAFVQGHRRGFADMREAQESGQKPPMHSEFRTYEVIAK